MKLCLGCGGKKHNGYTNLDIRVGVGDVQWDCSLPLPYPKDSIEEILTEAFIEHLFRHEATQAFKDWYNKLIPGGKLVIKWLPEFNKVIEVYQSGREVIGIKPFDWVFGAIMGCASDIPQVHKDIYTKESIKERLLNAGFKEVDVQFAIDKHKQLNIENPFPYDDYCLWVEAIK